MSATVPRVAESLADLRVGQIVAWTYHPDSCWNAIGGVVVSVDHHECRVNTASKLSPELISHFSNVDPERNGVTVFILRDAPAEPVTVPAEAVERLRTAADVILEDGPNESFDGLGRQIAELVLAARLVLDAIDGAGE